jgi:hypothetical protein
VSDTTTALAILEEETAEAPALQLPPPVQDDFLEALTGDWYGKYILLGIEFEATAEVKWAFNSQYVQALNHSRGSLGLVESQELWQPTKEKGVYKLWWFDPFGNAGIADAKATETGFVIHGHDPSMGSFRNSVTKNGPDELLFRLDAGPDEEGNFTKTGEGFYRRVGT